MPDPQVIETDELVTLIYKGPLEPVPWHAFLVALARRMACDSAGMTLRLSRKGLPPLIIWSTPLIGEAQARALQTVHAELGHLDPLRNALTKPGDIYLLDEVIDRAALEENEFYRKVMQPYGIEYELGMYISEPGGWECNVGLVNGPGKGNFDAGHKALLAALRPHLEQALALFSRIRRDETELQVLTETLDKLTISTFILDAQGRILRTNSAARRLIDGQKTFRAAADKLSLVRRQDNAAFQSLLARALEAAAPRGPGGFVDAMRIETDSGIHNGVLVRTIDVQQDYPGEVGPAVIVYVAGGDRGQPMERLVGQLFDLTPSEAHLANLLANGFSLAEAAEELGLTENTVRSYCKKILSKTGVGRQADLVRLILRSVAVLG
jgi:DNA-binding CsgD family transcriptional regulator